MQHIQELGDATLVLRDYVGNECSVGFRLEVNLDKSGNKSMGFCAIWGDVMSTGLWRWGCAHGATIDDCLRRAREEIERIKADHGATRRDLAQQAERIGCILVEKPTQPAAVD